MKSLFILDIDGFPVPICIFNILLATRTICEGLVAIGWVIKIMIQRGNSPQSGFSIVDPVVENDFRMSPNSVKIEFVFCYTL